MKEFVSVIIPTFRDNQRLQLCVDALKKQTIGLENFEVIIVDNDASGSVHLSELPENFVCIEEHSPGSYAARNKGINASKGSVLAFTDSDCVPTENWIEEALKAFAANEKISRIAGFIEIFPLSSNPDYLNKYEKMFAFTQERYASRGLSVTANMFVKKSVVEDVGLFDNRLFSGGDHEWSARAHSKGYAIQFIRTCVVFHPARNRSQILVKTRRLYPYYLKKNSPYHSRLFYLFFGFYLLRPSLKIFTSLRAERNTQLSTLDCIRIYLLMYQMRLTQFVEHYRLLFGGRKERM